MWEGLLSVHGLSFPGKVPVLKLGVRVMGGGETAYCSPTQSYSLPHPTHCHPPPTLWTEAEPVLTLV